MARSHVSSLRSLPPIGLQAGRGRRSAPVGIEAALWAADKRRGVMNAAEYAHVTLSLVFLKDVSDAFAEHHDWLLTDGGDGVGREDPDEHRAVTVIRIPPEARWTTLEANATQPIIYTHAET